MSSGRDQPRKWIVEAHDECPALLADMAARVRDPSIFLYLSIDPGCVDAWERSRIDDGDLSPDWVEWWLKSARALGNAGLYCVLAYIPNKRSWFRRSDFEFAPLAMGDLLGLLADGLHWGLPSQGGLFWSGSRPAEGGRSGYDGCILPCEGSSFIVANTRSHVALIVDEGFSGPR